MRGDRIMKQIWLAAILLAVFPAGALACEGPVSVCDGVSAAGFALIRDGKPATVYVDAGASKPVQRVAEDFAADLERVSGVHPAVINDLKDMTGSVVVIAVAGHSPLPVDEGGVAGKWEAYQQSVVDTGHGKALVILGADARGAIYGTYDLSAKMGVSPWYWWADVPVVKKTDLYVTAGSRIDAPKVKYRGFFINDEEPAFGGWAREKFGGINHQLYGHVFELELRLKGNYLWPAMWGKAFSDDDPLNQQTAAEYGIIMGTSHHEPMTRAQEEWHRHKEGGVTGGKWDYTTNADNLRTFWRGGIERMKAGNFENVVTVGMRGDGDEPMSEGTATHLLENIVADQRRIIADVTGKPADQTPQVWALYKEVQDYYDHGMTAPDDVTLLFSDDNWGQIRRLPDPTAPKRAGGYGVYYHFDYVGGPRNYKWINTNQIEKTWQQMDLAYDSGADRLWIVNVGDIKPMEFPLSFFMDMAWNPEAMTPEALKAYPAKWAGQQFGQAHAAEIGDILTRYSQYNARKKPELITADSFDITSLSEMELDYGVLAQQTQTLGKTLPANAKDAYFQLVEYPTVASANLYSLYYNTALNHLAALEGSPRANLLADIVEKNFQTDKGLAAQYNGLAGGKWNHMMDQTHIGYDNWQQPEVQVLPKLIRVPEKGKPAHNAYKSDRLYLRPSLSKAGTFVENEGAIAIEAQHFIRKTEVPGLHWQVIPELGRTLSSVVSLPQAAPATAPGDMALEYDFQLAKEVDVTLNLYLAPTLDTQGKGGLRIAVTIDDRPAQTLTFDLRPDTPQWTQAVKNNILILPAAFNSLKPGKHTIKVFRIDGNVMLERLVLDTGGLKPSYLGPPESAAN
ncbi:glycosyl hydrolase 115 family protein [Asticcacaulis taihuensis]|uniref:Glycosyl hydrolase family 115 n=2 Tax=Asticcacaulis taihuensis TaxID=260084 RepID=A0A1G4RVA6_9CAUL|nr:Glycosyl hydrolase family 115 [Asticcacaulis taihuensis]